MIFGRNDIEIEQQPQTKWLKIVKTNSKNS